jgi:N-acetylglucosamine-6-phosphate deacetylase
MIRFFDLQVNGYAGVDFNADDLGAEDLARACQRLLDDGIGGILATVITADLDRMIQRIGRIVTARESSEAARTVIQGIHVEGPFISSEPGYVGTHPSNAVQQASIAAAEQVVAAGAGLVRLVTLAPEQDAQGTTVRWLTDQGISVAAGHTNASNVELRTAIDQGLSLFTHLGNGCPLTLPRHDNIIQRVLSLSEQLWVCFIADGVHVPFPALANYLKVVGPERAIVVSDCIAAAGLGPGEYTLGAMKVVVDEQFATWSTDRTHLMGSALALPQAYSNLVEQLSLTPKAAHQLTCLNPKRAVRFG